MFTRAWLRGIALAALETIGFIQLYAGRPARVLVVAAIAADLIGALWRIWAAPRSTLPVARVVN